MQLPSADETKVSLVGTPTIPSPLALPSGAYVDEEERVLLTADSRVVKQLLAGGGDLPAFEKAGPRRKIFFDPATTCAGIVTCGGLCPGLNDVVRSIVLSLLNTYGVPKVLGFRFGYQGLSKSGLPPLNLSCQLVDGIQREPGSILGSSRGPHDPSEMVDTLERYGVNLLFTLGGDGTTRGAIALSKEIERRGLPISVIGVPKTIDNDVWWTNISFGFFTAVEEAKKAVLAGHAEAKGAENGVVVVKLMGRQSGFIAEYATLAASVANYCLVPEVPFELTGPQGLLPSLKGRLARKQHAVVVVAEGAGQNLFAGQPEERDASGNLKLRDIGVYLTDEIKKYLKHEGVPASVRYIDPSYLVRSTPADTLDSIFCLMLGIQAVHAGMAGRTAMCVGSWNQSFVHVPMNLLVQQRRVVDPVDQWWQAVEAITASRGSHGR